MKARRQSVILDVIQRAAGPQPGAAAPPHARGRLRRDAGDAVARHPRARAGQGWTPTAPIRRRRGRRPNGQTPASVLQRALGAQLRRIDRVQQLVLLRTGLGQAQSLCALLDGAGCPTWSARSPATTRFWSSRRMRGVRATLVKRLEEMSKRMKSPVSCSPIPAGSTRRRRFPGSSTRMGVEVVTRDARCRPGRTSSASARAGARLRRRARARGRRARRVRARRAAPVAAGRRRATMDRRHRSRRWRGRSSRGRWSRLRASKAPAPSRMARPTRRSMPQIHAIDPSMPILAPAREWTMSDADLDGLRARASPAGAGTRRADCQIDQNLWGRDHVGRREEPAAARAQAARCRRVSRHSSTFTSSAASRPRSTACRCRRPSSIESLSLIGGQHGVGRSDRLIAGRVTSSTRRRRRRSCARPRLTPDESASADVVPQAGRRSVHAC